MGQTTREVHGVGVLVLDREGPTIRDEAGALDVIGQTYGTGVDVVAIPVDRLDPAFAQLSSGVAGAIVQKFVNYRLRLVVVGELGATSGPVADWVREANRGRELWFVRDLDELEERLSAART
ncbi:DUF4180 domain-containing protein [Actinomycetospora lemnae]|uniref:DUF4180 domain-containing protein n=1 Tax=Actinomycetospora lemnae TaxID=3019891 RepID=A0ABT5SW61_9PSEU|nr:DUF4180 domain-containing protein [Actinomycetospora sp. DW7H6]MDD7967009.1 DUF4180 domain-containing protein [Actinomycetospora sp. DW7H6]